MKHKSLACLLIGSALLLNGCRKESTTEPVTSVSSPDVEVVAASPYEKVSFTSPADRYQCTGVVVMPQSGTTAEGAVLCLGAMESFSAFLESRDDLWKIWIPSRPGMNYQLLAEGDLWGLWDRIVSEYPEIGTLPLYLAGEGEGASAAAQIANHYRSRCAGIAIGSNPHQLNVPNLDQLPVAAYGSANEGFVARLQQRGNSQAAHITGDLQEALHLLRRRQMAAPTLAPYTFSDNRYRQAWTWLEVVARRSEEESVTVSAKVEGDTLLIEGDNILAVAIDRSPAAHFPKGVTKIRLGNQLTVLQQKSTGRDIIGEPDATVRWKRKSDSPSGFSSFFAGEPVVVVYQDDGADRTYLEAAQAFAERLSQLKLAGLPTLPVNVPLQPLSRYNPSSYPRHRLIAVGSHRVMHTLAQNSPGYLPLPRRSEHDHPQTYGLIFPPEKQPNVSLACLLVADSLEGLKAIDGFYGSAAALSSTADLVIWSPKDNTYTWETSSVFDSYWGQSNHAPFTLNLPRQGSDTWEQFLEEVLMQESGASMVILPSLMSFHLSMPTEITAGSLNRYIPDRQFAIITGQGSASTEPLNTLLTASNRGHMQGLAPYMTTEEGAAKLDPKKLRKQTLRVLVDYNSLQQLPEEQRALIGYEILPFSLHELLLRRMKEDPRAFVKDLLRQGKPGR